MGRRRKLDRHLPAKVSFEHNMHWYRDGKKPRIALGQAIGEALNKYAALVGPLLTLPTLGHVIDKYVAEVLPLKRAAKTRLEEGRALGKLKDCFGDMRPDTVTSVDLYGYIDNRRNKAGRLVPVAAKHEIILLGHVYKKAIRWGAAEKNPASGLEYEEKAGKRPYVPQAWVDALRPLATPRMRLAIDLAVMMGQRRGDLLKLRFADVRPDGIYVLQGKTQWELIMEMSPALQNLLDQSKAMAPQIPREYVIRQTNGQPYTGDGFAANWKRLMRRHVKAGGERFQFKDLRAVSANAADTLVEAQARMGHSTPETTQRFYRTAISKAKPAS